MPPIKTLICATDDPKIAGNISFIERRTPSWRQFSIGRGSARIFSRNGN